MARLMTKPVARRFEEAVREYTVNVSQHMVKIKQELETTEQSGSKESVARKEELLEELLEIVENIDNAKGESPNLEEAALSLWTDTHCKSYEDA